MIKFLPPTLTEILLPIKGRRDAGQRRNGAGTVFDAGTIAFGPPDLFHNSDRLTNYIVTRGKGRKLMSFQENMHTVIAMTDFLPREVRAELDAQRRRDLKGRSRIRVQAGEALYPVLRLSGNSFTLDADDVTHLRGLVDLFDGARHVRQCLIIASDVVSGELVCTMKWSRTVSETAPLDYERDENAPTGYLPRF